jgi:hypothetical protein
MEAGGVRLFRYRDPEEVDRTYKGELTPDRIRLNGRTLPLLAIATVDVEGDVLHLGISVPGGRQPRSLRIVGSNAGELRTSIAHTLDSWESTHPGVARGEDIRVQACPRCGDYIYLRGFPDSPQVYCGECDIVFTRGGQGPPEELEFTTCPLCGYYTKISPFRSFYLIFLCLPGLGHFMTSSVDAPDGRCHPCMRKDAWRMVLVNLLGCVAVPYGLYQLLRAYFFGTRRAFRQLDAANMAARKGRAEEADALYRGLLERGTSNAGVELNRGQARLAASDAAGALDRARDALRTCANYARALDLSVVALRALGREGDAESLARAWPRPGLDLTQP